MNTPVFLDFDGVLCDSVLECYVSSFLAFYQDLQGQLPHVVSIDHYSRFVKLRPYIRSGGDYPALQKILYDGLPCKSQKDFDSILSSWPKEMVAGFDELFYAVRHRLIAQDRSWWLSLSPLFPGIREALLHWSCSPQVYILSTKRPALVAEILAGNAIDWPAERILCNGEQSKVSVIAGVCRKLNAERAIFVEDQIDHFHKQVTIEGSLGLECYLASWGYIKDEWRLQPDFPLININQFIETISNLLETSEK